MASCQFRRFDLAARSQRRGTLVQVELDLRDEKNQVLLREHPQVFDACVTSAAKSLHGNNLTVEQTEISVKATFLTKKRDVRVALKQLKHAIAAFFTKKPSRRSRAAQKHRALGLDTPSTVRRTRTPALCFTT